MKPKTADKIATIAMYAISGSILLLLVVFIGYFVYSGRSELNLHFLFSAPEFAQAGGGIGPQLFNSLYLVLLSDIICVPIGIAAGIYMSEYAKPGKLTSAIRFCVETLASLPSIVIGLFGLIVFVVMTGWKYTLFGGALAVSILNLPTITRNTENALQSIPIAMKEASLALGATQWQTIRKVLLPSAMPSLITGVILISGRAFGEAAALLFTAGMSNPRLDFTNWNPFSASSPLNPFRPAETLAVYIWKINSEGLVPDARQIADGASAVLILFVLLFNLSARYFSRIASLKFSGKHAKR